MRNKFFDDVFASIEAIIDPSTSEADADAHMDKLADYAKAYQSDEDPDKEYRALREEIASLRAKLAETSTPSIDSFSDLRDLVAKKLNLTRGRERGWQLAFQVGTDHKYDWSDITKWGKSNKVPESVIAAMENFDVEKAKAAISKPQLTWKDEHRNALRGYMRIVNGKSKWIEGHTGATVAAKLTEVFGIEITEGSLKSQKSRIDKEGGVNEIKEAAD